VTAFAAMLALLLAAPPDTVAVPDSPVPLEEAGAPDSAATPDAAPAEAPARLLVASDVPGARVFLDGSEAGVTPLTIGSLGAGIHELEVRPPNEASWLMRTVRRSVQLAPGETLEWTAVVAPSLLFQTIPSGAEVLLGDSLLGVTPVVLDRGVLAGARPPVVRRNGYAPVILSPAVAGGSRDAFTLPLDLTDPGMTPEDPFRPPPVSPLPKILAAGGAVAAGAMAAALKVQADNSYDEYLLTGDPALKADAHVYDTEAAMALVATQACLVLLAYLLFKE